MTTGFSSGFSTGFGAPRKYAIGADWNNANHWSNNDGGIGGAGVPTSADLVSFTSNSIDMSLSANGTCDDILMAPGFANKLSVLTHTLTIDSASLGGGTFDLGSGTVSFIKDWLNTGTTVIYGTSTVYMRHSAAYYTITPGSGEFYAFDQQVSAFNTTLVGNLVTHGKLSLRKPFSGTGVFKPAGDYSGYVSGVWNQYYATSMLIDTNATHTLKAEVVGAWLPPITINKTGGMSTFEDTFDVAGDLADSGFIITHGRAFTDLSASTMRMLPFHRTLSGVTFGALDIRAGAYDIIISGDNTVEGLLTLTSLQELKGTGILRARGAVTQTDATSIIGTGTTEFIIDGSAGDQVITNLKWGSQGTFEIDKPVGDAVIVGNLQIGNDTVHSTLSGDIDVKFQSDIDFTTHNTTFELIPHNQTINVHNPFITHHLKYRSDRSYYDGNVNLLGNTIYVTDWYEHIASSSGTTYERKINNGTIRICGNLSVTMDRATAEYRGTALVMINGCCGSLLTGDGNTDRYFNDVTVQKDTTPINVEIAAAIGLRGATLTINTGRLLAANAFRCEDLDNHDELWLRTGSEPTVDGVDTKNAGSRVTFYDVAVDAIINDYATTFKRLRFGTGLKTYNFDAGVLTTVVEGMCTDGNSSQRAVLRSTVTGTQWELDLQGISALDAGVDVQDSDASAGNKVNVLGSVLNNTVNWENGTSGNVVGETRVAVNNAVTGVA